MDGCNGCECGQGGDEQFWEDLAGLLIQAVCLIEREKLNRPFTTSELRKAGKGVLCQQVDNRHLL